MADSLENWNSDHGSESGKVTWRNVSGPTWDGEEYMMLPNLRSDELLASLNLTRLF